MADITMPQLGESVTEGTITQWFKAVGDSVAVDELLFEVSTDKVDTEVPSPVAGVLSEIRANEGDTVNVGDVIAVVASSADAVDTAPAAAPPSSVVEPVAVAPAASDPEPVAGPVADVVAEPAIEPVTPVPVAAPAEPTPVEPVSVAAVPTESAPAVERAETESAEEAVLLSPVVRRLMTEAQLTPNDVVGTGLGGRITREDVLRAMDARPASGAPSATAPVAAAPAAVVPAPVVETATPASVPGAAAAPPIVTPAAAPAVAPAPVSSSARPGSVVVEPFNKIRKVTGEHMVASKATSPHVVTAVEVDFERVEQARREHKARFAAEEGFSLTYLPFISRAVVEALQQFPRINATVGAEGLEVHGDINLAYAVDLNFEGLLAPVMRSAGDKRLRAIAREIRGLADRARSKKLTPDDLSGGTFTISNSGSYGTFMVTAIINQPQVAILSTDGVARKPVVISDERGNESLAIHSVGLLTLSWDHRAFDGAYAAAFMQRLREVLETRDWMSEL